MPSDLLLTVIEIEIGWRLLALAIFVTMVVAALIARNDSSDD